MSLPNGYTQLEYIYASGKQYINTGHIATSKTTAKYKVCLNGFQTYGPHILSGENFFFPLFRGYTYSPFFAHRGGTDYKKAELFYAGNIYEVDAFTNDIVTVNGTSYGTFACGSKKTDTTPLYLMTYPGAKDDPGFTMRGYLYYCQIIEDGVLVRDFVPAVRDADLEVGLYDLVNGVFYTNDGTGAFISNEQFIDTRVPKEYTKLSYIQSDGQQYIDTGYCPSANTRVCAKVKNLSTTLVGFYGAQHTANSCAFAFYINTNGRYAITYGAGRYTDLAGAIQDVTVVDQTGASAIAKLTHSTLRLSIESATFTSIDPYSMYIFGHNLAGNLGNAAPMQFYYLQAYDNGVLVRWFVPVRRKSDGEIGLYDAVSKEFYANQGTGAFIAGEDLPDDPWEEPEPPALVIGGDIRITEGMTIRNGVLHRIVLS